MEEEHQITSTVTATAVSDFVSRRMNEDARNEAVSEHIKRLSAYETATDPDSAKIAGDTQKDDIAFAALSTARALVTATAGWAIDHVIGRALKDQEFVAIRLSDDAKRSEAIARKSEANLLDHEIAGARIHSEAELDPIVARKILLNLLIADCAGFPAVITRMAVEALRALPFNEVLPIFEPAKGARKRRFRELELQLRAVTHVEYRAARLKKEGKREKGKAVDEVAHAYNVDRVTLLKWKERTRLGLGEWRFSQAVYLAKFWANHIDLTDFPPARYDRADRRWFFDPMGLKHDAESYNKSLKRAKK